MTYPFFAALPWGPAFCVLCLCAEWGEAACCPWKGMWACNGRPFVHLWFSTVYEAAREMSALFEGEWGETSIEAYEFMKKVLCVRAAPNPHTQSQNAHVHTRVYPQSPPNLPPSLYCAHALYEHMSTTTCAPRLAHVATHELWDRLPSRAVWYVLVAGERQEAG